MSAPSLEQRIAQTFGIDALTHLAQRHPGGNWHEFAEACLLWAWLMPIIHEATK